MHSLKGVVKDSLNAKCSFSRSVVQNTEIVLLRYFGYIITVDSKLVSSVVGLPVKYQVCVSVPCAHAVSENCNLIDRKVGLLEMVRNILEILTILSISMLFSDHYSVITLTSIVGLRRLNKF